MKPISAALMAICLLLTSLARAGEAAQSEETDALVGAHAVQLAAVPVFLFSPNRFCERDSDVIGCTSGMGLIGFHAEAHYRFPFAWFAAGVIGGADFEMNQAQICSSDSGCEDVQKIYLWRAAVEARFYPLLHRRVELWLALEGGVVGAGGRAIADVAPETGLGLGLDFPIGRHFFIGLDIRCLFFGFGKAPQFPPDGGKVQMTNTLWSSNGLLKLGGRFGLWP